MDISKVDSILANSNDYYGVLGLTKSANKKEIRRSYYELAVQLHPDKNAGNAKLADAFRVVLEAYNVLIDETKRGVYDREGLQGLRRYEDFQSASFKDIVVVVFRSLGVLIMCALARQTYTIEALLERHPWVEPFIGNTQAVEFAIRHRSQRAMIRRVVRRRLAFLLILLFSLLLGHNVWQRFKSDTEELSPWTMYQDLSRKDTDHTGRTFLCDPMGDGAPGGGANTRGVFVWRPNSVSEADAKSLCRRWVREMCPLQEELAWASRERYEPTATLRVNRTLRAVPSPNRAAKQKWPFKRWRPRFLESFSVKSREELFVVSPLCEAFG